MVLVNSVFHMQKNFSENYQQFGYAPSKNFASPVLSKKCSKSISFKGLKLLTCLGSPQVSDWAWQSSEFVVQGSFLNLYPTCTPDI